MFPKLSARFQCFGKSSLRVSCELVTDELTLVLSSIADVAMGLGPMVYFRN